MNKEIRVVRVESAGPVEKVPAGPYSPWSVRVRYICEDGRTFDGRKGFRLKRDAVAYLATLPSAPPRPLFVCLGDDGTMWGTKESFRLFA